MFHLIDLTLSRLVCTKDILDFVTYDANEEKPDHYSVLKGT